MMKKVFATALLLIAAATSASAQLRIGQSAGFTGAVAGSVKEATSGASLYFEAINAQGGVNGQKIELISLDDKFDPKLTLENSKKLIAQGVVSLFLMRGTPHMQAIMPLLNEEKIPLVGPSTGAMVLHDPVHPWIFNVRTTYQREAERAVAQLSVMNVKRIAIVRVDDSFGADVATGVLNGLKNMKLEPVAHEKYDRTKPDFSTLIPKVAKADPQTVIFIGTAVAVAEGMKALRASGSNAQMLTMSNTAFAGFIKSLGPLAHGVVVSQVFPSERLLGVAMVKQAHDLATVKGIELTPTVLEGFAAAKVMVEGLRKAGNKPTRVSVQKALEGLKRFDLGGLEISYSPTDHTGLEYTDLSIVDPEGKFRR
jgi:branched-chain amino acid transport system substrate-binding protein